VAALEGKTAIVTGASSGIGAATAAALAREGARVAGGARRVDELQTEIRLELDVTDRESCERFVEAVTSADASGGLDILVNNAGVYFPADTLSCTEEEWDEQVDSSLKGTFLMSKHALPHMIERGSGSVVNMSSGWGLEGGDQAVAYCAAKGGVTVMTKAMALDHGPQGIRVNAVCPGDTMTPMEEADAERRGMAWSEYVRWASDRPLRRMGEAEEIARAVLFLASDESSFVTGAALPVDGGGVAG